MLSMMIMDACPAGIVEYPLMPMNIQTYHVWFGVLQWVCLGSSSKSRGRPYIYATLP